ncbi:MAG: NADH:flavin oxidoreductase [Sphaerochaetaceae bacterium]|nr:NADH:flavin oxidoreductase [Sphaerochaetaceae bacterium]
MSDHQRFSFKDKTELQNKIDELSLKLKLSEDLSVFKQPLLINGHEVANRIAILPMEGCDSELDGSPSELVQRRYSRFFLGGAGLVWWEANAVLQEGRANEHSMFINLANMQTFAFLLKDLRTKSYEANGYSPLSILQLTHSGRYSRPVGHNPAPIITQHDPILDPRVGLDGSEPVASDDYLESLIPKYVQSAALAREAGFDGVDIKCCHRYLLSELLGSHLREGRYGGSFENRISLIMQIIQAVRKAVGDDFIIASRFNVFDAHPYPYGFGEDEHDMWKFKPEEPMELVRRMVRQGVNLLSNSAGNPYYIYPQVTRPFDQSSMGIPTPDEHPLQSIERLFDFTAQIQKAAGDVPVIGNGYSWLREFAQNMGSANIRDGRCAMMGLGRQAIAYPDAPVDILRHGGMQRAKCCLACSKCTQIMRDHGMTGCVMRDTAIYGPLYKKYRQEAEERECQKR